MTKFKTETHCLNVRSQKEVVRTAPAKPSSLFPALVKPAGKMIQNVLLVAIDRENLQATEKGGAFPLLAEADRVEPRLRFAGEAVSDGA